MYLNKVYFGDGLYGVEAAARGYLGKSAADLTRGRGGAARRTDPVAFGLRADRQPRSRARAPRRRAADDGDVGRDRCRRPRSGRRRAPVKLVNGLEVNESSGLYFKEAVRRELVERFGWQRVSQGGLRVYTTLDTELQRTAEALVEKNLQEIEGRRGFTHPPRAKVGAGEGR